MKHILLKMLIAGAALGFAAYKVGKMTGEKAAGNADEEEWLQYDPYRDAEKPLREQMKLCLTKDGKPDLDLLECLSDMIAGETTSGFDRLDQMVSISLVESALLFMINEVPESGWCDVTLAVLLEKMYKPGVEVSFEALIDESAKKHPETPYEKLRLRYHCVEDDELERVAREVRETLPV